MAVQTDNEGASGPTQGTPMLRNLSVSAYLAPVARLLCVWLRYASGLLLVHSPGGLGSQMSSEGVRLVFGCVHLFRRVFVSDGFSFKLSGNLFRSKNVCAQ